MYIKYVYMCIYNPYLYGLITYELRKIALIQCDIILPLMRKKDI